MLNGEYGLDSSFHPDPQNAQCTQQAGPYNIKQYMVSFTLQLFEPDGLIRSVVIKRRKKCFCRFQMIKKIFRYA